MPIPSQTIICFFGVLRLGSEEKGGLSKMWQLFGDSTEKIIEELNEVLAA